MAYNYVEAFDVITALNVLFGKVESLCKLKNFNDGCMKNIFFLFRNEMPLY